MFRDILTSDASAHPLSDNTEVKVAYFAPEFSWVLKLGNVFVDWKCPNSELCVEGLRTPNRRIQKLEYSLRIQSFSYNIKNLSIAEYDVNEELKDKILEKLQEIKYVFALNGVEQAFFVYGTASGQEVLITQGGEPLPKATGERVFAAAVLKLTLSNGTLEMEKLTKGADFYI
ncbi:hypothetical protein NQ176_g841 [Zarea fungicola]|uniref:Uncharacterized protein n=1 Tax=Zarea fungicola TaxID=93591 RepID=A0ACC1NVS0_9HYPO|nr:hypothetical protein NQ176_g841 [Lecanicillium fungicola]